VSTPSENSAASIVRACKELQRTPFLSLLAVAAAVVVFIGMTIDTPSRWEDFQRFGYFAADAIWRGAYWGLVTSAFVHGDLLHLIFNVYWLWNLGGPLERIVGPVRFLVLLLASAFVSASIQLSTSDDTGIGASGIAYALFGFLWVAQRRQARFRGLIDERTTQVFLLWLVACFPLTYLGILNIANAAHVGGLLFGAATAATLVTTPVGNQKGKERGVGATALGALILAASLPLVWCPWSPTWLSVRAYDAHAAEEYATAVDYYTRILGLDEENAWAYVNRSFAYASLGDMAKSEADRSRALEIDPSIVDETSETDAESPHPGTD